MGPRALARMPRVRQGFLPPVGMAWDPGWRWVLALGAGAGLPCCRPALSQNWAAESHCRMGAVTHQNRHCNQYQACTCMRASLYLFPGCRGPAPRLPGSQPMPVPCCLGPAPRLHGSQRVPIPWSMRLPHRASEDPAQLRVLIVVPVPAQLDCPHHARWHLFPRALRSVPLVHVWSVDLAPSPRPGREGTVEAAQP